MSSVLTAGRESVRQEIFRKQYNVGACSKDKALAAAPGEATVPCGPEPFVHGPKSHCGAMGEAYVPVRRCSPRNHQRRWGLGCRVQLGQDDEGSICIVSAIRWDAPLACPGSILRLYAVSLLSPGFGCSFPKASR